MPPVGFEPTISEGVPPQIYALDRVATGLTDSTEDGRETDVFVIDSNKEQSIHLQSP